MVVITKIQIPTLPTKKTRRLYVYLPKDYDKSDRHYPVLYMFDGHNVFFDSHATYGKSWGMKKYLDKTKMPLIVAAVECNHEGNRRLSEYAPYDFKSREFGSIKGRGKLTMDWIVEELKPYIDSTYRTLPEREHTLIAGSSMGGLMSLYAVIAYNEVFGKAAALSPSIMFGGKELYALLKETTLNRPTRVYIDAGTEEVPKGRDTMLSPLFEGSRKLTLKGAEVAARIVPGGEHCEAAWEQRIPVFLPYLLEGK